MYFLCQVFQAIPRETSYIESTFRHFASVALAIDVFHTLKQQQKLTFFEKRKAVEPPENDEDGPEKDGEKSEESSINITTSQLREPTASS